MKTKLTLYLVAYTLSAFVTLAQTNTFPSTGSAGIGTLTPNASSLLEVKSTTKGILIPRMTSIERNAIILPSTGLLVYQVDGTTGFYYYDGANWNNVAQTGDLWATNGNIGTNSTTNFIGTKDTVALLIKVNNQKSGIINFNSRIASTGFGYQILLNSKGNNNTANGYQALLSNTTGSYNTATGSPSLLNNTNGSGNTAIGAYGLYANTIGSQNTASGYVALSANTTGWGNTANGSNSLAFNTTGSENTANGFGALFYNTIGLENTATGFSALGNNDSGNYNTANGMEALIRNYTGSYNTALGYQADVIVRDLTNATVIGSNAIVDASNKVQIGNESVTSIGGQVGWSQFSDERVKNNVKENVPGLEFIKALRPVTYHFSVSKEEELLGVKGVNHKDISYVIKRGSTRAEIKERLLASGESISNIGAKDVATPKGKYDIEQVQFTGLIAQEVDAAAKKINYEFSGVDKTGKIWGLRYGDFVVPLVKAVQELSQKNDVLKKQNDELKSRLDKLEAAVFQSHSGSQTIELGSAARLEQNIPNPFNNTTSIEYYLPTNTSIAYINFYSLDGVLLKSVKLANTGKGTINVKANELPSGVYQYALVVDGKVVQYKQMIQAH